MQSNLNNNNNLIIELNLNQLKFELNELNNKNLNSNLKSLNLIEIILNKLELIKLNLNENSIDSGVNSLGNNRIKMILKDLNNLILSSNLEILTNFKESNQSLNKLTKSIEKKFPTTTPPLSSLFPSKPLSTTSTTTTTFTPTSLYSSTPTSPLPLPPTLIRPTSTSTSSSSSSTTTPPTEENKEPFSSIQSKKALHKTIALHLARLNLLEPLETFLSESTTQDEEEGDDEDECIKREEIEPSKEVMKDLKNLWIILDELNEGVCGGALRWLEGVKSGSGGGGSTTFEEAEKSSKVDKNRDLEFELHKEVFIRILLSSSSTTTSNSSTTTREKPIQTEEDKEIIRKALEYGSLHFRNLLVSPTTSTSSSSTSSSSSSSSTSRDSIIGALFTSVLYLPLSHLLSSPYSSLYKPYFPSSTTSSSPDPSSFSSQSSSPDSTTTKKIIPNANLITNFTSTYLNYINQPLESPLSIVSQIGGTVALSRILKVNRMMMRNRTEWSCGDEMAVEIPLANKYKYHSIFICPVSKEQSTFENYPILLNCGHVLVKESLGRLAKGGLTVKCPYCPIASRVSSAIRLYF